MKLFKIFFGMLFFTALILSCEKEATTYPVTIKLTDNPGPYEAVWVDVQGVELTGEDGNVELIDVNPGLYDLISLSNGQDTIIATGDIENSVIEQIRLILGIDNTVVIDGESFPLDTPSAQQSGLKLQVHETLTAGVNYSILLDFDANKSVVQHGNDDYSLKPVIRTIQTAISGSIQGVIEPVGVVASVTAEDSIGEIFTSNVNENGQFIIMGLHEGIYSVTVTPEAPYLEYMVENIEVTVGETNVLDTITLTQ